MRAYKGVIQSITADEFIIKLIGGNMVKTPYSKKYSHMKKYETIWVFTNLNGKVTELHTLRHLKQKQKRVVEEQLSTTYNWCPELLEIEQSEEIGVEINNQSINRID